MTTLWIIVLIFIVFALAAGTVQMLAAFADRRRAREIARDESRPHPEGGHGDTGQTGPRSGGSDWDGTTDPYGRE
jgi:hypothetical protein